ncbi:MAG: virulence protein RhuM/Fic/DOC family protein [Bacilli bacterium]|nr:virulence protein RhuM/Fic/DOC family protein [Bacilli bacterium]
MKNEIILFEDQNVKLEVNMQDETVWLNTQQMSQLFNRDFKTIRKHINNALKEELSNEVVVAKFANTTDHGAIKGKTQMHMVEYYNLDMIISVGYRVNSTQGVAFRKWATKVLKDYMLKGYAVNKQRLDYLEKTVKLIDIANRMDERLENNDAKEILKVIGNYSKALDILDDYDHHTLTKVKGKSSTKKITYRNCMDIIKKLRFNEESKLFALERNNGLESIINNIYQTYDNKEVYNSTEEKAANFLYMIVKNHVFIDGNKRIAATLFIYFLQFYNILYIDNKQVIDNNTLVALTLLIAESNPKEKKIIIDLIMNFLLN